MSEWKAWHNETWGVKVVEALKANHFAASYIPTKEEAVKALLTLIPSRGKVGFGGSETLRELGLSVLLEDRGNTVLNHNKPGLSPQEAGDIRKQQLTCDAFITSSNAVTLKGELVNVDGTGNRVAAMMYGPGKVIVVVGINKIVKDLDAAVERIKQVAAPLNNKRLNRPNPCTTTGQCMDCQGPTRICNITTILHKRPGQTDMHVLVVGEEIGF